MKHGGHDKTLTNKIRPREAESKLREGITKKRTKKIHVIDLKNKVIEVFNVLSPQKIHKLEHETFKITNFVDYNRKSAKMCGLIQRRYLMSIGKQYTVNMTNAKHLFVLLNVNFTMHYQTKQDRSYTRNNSQLFTLPFY